SSRAPAYEVTSRHWLAGTPGMLGHRRDQAPRRCSRLRNLATIGPSVGPPSPPWTVTMANATSLVKTSLLKPMSQASVGSGLPWPYCAVPVLAYVPAGRPLLAAVPDATTCAIIVC